MTRRRWIADAWDNTTASLSGEQATHLTRVLRAEVGMEYDVVAGDRVWHASVSAIAESSVRFHLLAEVGAAEALAITVLLSIFKFDRLEWAIEKLTELDVSTIQPVIARRTEKHLAQAAMTRVVRWRRIALESAKQSRRSSVPVIEDPVQLKGALPLFASAPMLRLVLAENEKQHTLAAMLKASGDEFGVAIAVGPEGGWTAEEEALFAEHAWVPVTLGPTILRAETATIAAVAIAGALVRSRSVNAER